ncbi:hypothetical protein BV20DRAFT_1043719 [Pilatotrama ljubarskyi]|nr:hypothetical protein BV20DRAFT_1043719 [Pilatotrama ljubarskyi]
MSSEDQGPPWYVTDADGKIDYGAVPERLLRHPELQESHLRPQHAMKPGVVFGTLNSRNFQGAEYVIKVLDLTTEELPIYERLLRDIHSTANHTVPSKILYSDHPVLVMPYLNDIAPHVGTERRRPLTPLVRAFHDLAEGVEYLHSLRIAHLDLCEGNVVVASPREAAQHEGIVSERYYIIDFNSAKQFPLGPGRQHAITLPDTQNEPPNGLTIFDPYSWDVYCLGLLLKFMLQMYYGENRHHPWIARWFTTWLIGRERGCSRVCHCRPSARTARRVLAVFGWIAPIMDAFSSSN